MARTTFLLRSRLRPLVPAAALLLPFLLGGCDLVVFNAAGDVARQQGHLILWSTLLMLLIIVPVMVLTVLFAIRYRAANPASEDGYDPDWDHSTMLELIIWSAPLLIIIALGALTWVATHTLDPYRQLARIAPGRPLPANDRPLEVAVVALDWKWLFIYPEQGIATVNELVLPANRQVRFRLTSSSVMNTFYVPAMAGMIYTMPGMETKLHAVLNRTGRFEGISANYSGAGFSDMRFVTTSTDAAGFARWVAQVKAGPVRAGQARALSAAEYMRLEKPSEKVPAMRYAAVQPGLFDRIVQMCVKPGQPCMGDTVARDRMAPGTHAPVNDRPADAGEAEGAILKDPGEKGSSPHLTKPGGPPKGESDPGDQANRNMTSLDRPARPGTVATAQS